MMKDKDNKRNIASLGLLFFILSLALYDNKKDNQDQGSSYNKNNLDQESLK